MLHFSRPVDQVATKTKHSMKKTNKQTNKKQIS